MTGVRHEVATFAGVGTTYTVYATGVHPDNRFDVEVGCGSALRDRKISEGVSWVEACDVARDAVAAELEGEGATASSVGRTVEEVPFHDCPGDECCGIVGDSAAEAAWEHATERGNR